MGFGVGIVIGTGIFTLTGIEAKNHAGPGVVISFGIAGVVSLLAALCYAEMSSAVPTAGSAYTYAYATIGEVFAWIIGWDLILEFALGAAVVARGWSGYLQELFGLPPSIFGEGSIVNVGAIAIVLVLGVVALVGIRESARVTNALVVIKVAICLFVIVAGAFFVQKANLTPFVPAAAPVKAGTSGLKQPLGQALFGIEPSAFGFAGILTAAAVVFFAYTGFEAVANMGEETRRPARDLPLGLLGTLGLCTVLYIGVSFVLTGMVKYDRISEGAPIANAFEQVGLSWAAKLVSVAAICGLTRSSSWTSSRRAASASRWAATGSSRRPSPRSTPSGARRTASRPAPSPSSRSWPGSSRSARWPTWSASARCSPSSSSRWRCRCCAAPSRT